MARDEYINQRMLNWGRWKHGRSGGGLGFASTNWSAFMAEDRYTAGSAAVMPDDEEVITDLAVTSLAKDVQEALFEQYVEGGTADVKARRLGCHERTFRNRVDNGLRLVGRWLTEREEANQRERDRVEALQRYAASGDSRELSTPRDKPYLGGDWLKRG